MKYIIYTLLFFAPIASDAQLIWDEIEIPMSDGFTLEADLYLPPNWQSGPTILIQTPYNKNFYHLIGLPIGVLFDQDSLEYAIVIADWRGFWGSADAAYSGSPTRGEDGYDCVQWIAAQNWCDGNVGTWGPSALGKVQFQTARENPPNLRCIAPQVAGPQFEYDEYYTGGALRTEFINQLDGLGFGLGPVVISNPYENLLWDLSSTANYYPEEIQVPAFMAGGWYDHNIEVMLDFFSGLQNESPENVQSKHRLLMGPWVHGGNSNANVGSPNQGALSYPEAMGWSDSLSWVFFDYYLKGIDNGWEETSPIRYFQMGDNTWSNTDQWPPASSPFNLYLHSTSELLPDLPTQQHTFEFDYDPSDPSPTIGGATLSPDLLQGPYDQAPDVESRNDILVFSTPALTADVKIIGSIKVHLNVSSDQLDTDFMVRLCDVYPDGRSMLVHDGAFRMRFKNGFASSDISFMNANETYDIEIVLPNTAITFLQGHRIRLDISSSNYPRYNRNSNSGDEMYPELNSDTLVNPVVAHNSLHQTTSGACFITLPLVGNYPTQLQEQEVAMFDFYPQPASDIIQWRRSSAVNTELTVTSSQGQLVLRKNISGTSGQLNIGSLAPGNYVLRIDGVSKNLVVY